MTVGEIWKLDLESPTSDDFETCPSRGSRNRFPWTPEPASRGPLARCRLSMWVLTVHVRPAITSHLSFLLIQSCRVHYCLPLWTIVRLIHFWPLFNHHTHTHTHNHSFFGSPIIFMGLVLWKRTVQVGIVGVRTTRNTGILLFSGGYITWNIPFNCFQAFFWFWSCVLK